MGRSSAWADRTRTDQVLLSRDRTNWSPDDMRNWPRNVAEKGTDVDKQQERIGSSATLINDRRGDLMVESEAVSAMLRLKGLGWGTRRIAGELGVSRTTVRDYYGGRRVAAVSESQAGEGARRSPRLGA